MNLGRQPNLNVGLKVVVAAAFALSAALSTVPQASPAHGAGSCAPDVQFIGFSDSLNKSNFGGFAVSELSGVTYDGNANVYYAIADRAGEVATHVFTLTVPVTPETLGAPAVTAATVLKTAIGNQYNGFTFDGEGIVLTPDNELVVVSESGSAAGEQPEIRRFSLSGQHRGDLVVPARFLIGPNNLSFESLALSPSGQVLFAANEGPLSADGITSDLRSRIRIVSYYNHPAPTGFIAAEEFFYLTEPGRNATELGVSDMLALSNEDLLVLERGFVRDRGNTVRVFHVSTRGAADVSRVAALSQAGVTPLRKTLVFDLANCPPSGAQMYGTQPNALLDNFEAMALGPTLSDGRRVLVLISDDNSANAQVTRVIALSVRPETLLAPSPATPTALPRTGDDLAQTGFVALLAGLLLLALGWRFQTLRMSLRRREEGA